MKNPSTTPNAHPPYAYPYTWPHTPMDRNFHFSHKLAHDGADNCTANLYTIDRKCPECGIVFSCTLFRRQNNCKYCIPHRTKKHVRFCVRPNCKSHRKCMAMADIIQGGPTIRIDIFSSILFALAILVCGHMSPVAPYRRRFHLKSLAMHSMHLHFRPPTTHT